MNSAVASSRVSDLRQRIAQFVSAASTEITPHDELLVPALAAALPVGTPVYVAHTPNSTLHDVVRVSIDLQHRGMTATPHIVARRLESEKMLRDALRTLRGVGINQVLIIAGDIETAAGPFASTLGVIDSGALTDAGLLRIGFAGHPEGHPTAGRAALFDALCRKQQFATQAGIAVHLVTQIGFDAHAIVSWVQAQSDLGIHLPVHVGLAGPTSLSKLMRFAVQCGVRTSLQAALKSPGSMGSLVGMKTTSGELIPTLLKLGAGEELSQIAKPHFFALGGALANARWLSAATTGRFEFLRDGSIKVHDPLQSLTIQ